MLIHRIILPLIWTLFVSTVHGFAVNNVITASTTVIKKSSLTATTNSKQHDGSEPILNEYKASSIHRRQALQKAAAIFAATASSSLINPATALADIEGVVAVPQSTAPPESSAQNVDGKSVTVFKTKSGLQYIDLVEGTGISPKYGNFVSISYKAYIKLPDIKGKTSKLDQFDADYAYLVKHGNGRTVPGLEEGIHTMKVGGKRRIIIPPKLGYVTGGLGPIPPGPYGRWKLNHLLDKMIEVKGGNLVFDVEIRSVIEDEADQGYYDDESLSPEDFNTLRQNLERSQQEARENA
jgi:FKBP-type peptidyl-prolyl cis-trans isomerase